MSSYEYHQILQFLYFEGYADSYAEAEELVESLSDEEFQDLIEDDSWKERNFRPLSKTKKARVTGFLNSQMIKLKDYSNQADIAQDELKNPDYSKPPRVKIGTLLKKMKTGSKLMSNAQQARKRTTEREEGRNNIRKFKREDIEYILDTLISEGFAVDYDSAGCILEAMSDEWANQILDEEYKDLTPEKEERVKNRVGELARDIQVQSGRMKDLKKKPFGKYRPKVKQEKEAILKSTRKKQKLVQNASDALIRTSTSRSASIQKRIQDLKDQS